MNAGRWIRLGCLPALLQASVTAAVADITDHDTGSFPFVSAAYTNLPNADVGSANPGSELKAKETQLAFGFWRFGQSRWTFDIGLDYQYNHYAYENIDSRNRDLHRLQLPLGFSRRSVNWSLAGFIAPGVATSSNIFKDLIDRGSSDDFVLTGRAEFTFPQSARLRWLLGAAYDRSFGEDMPYPVFGLLYQSRDGLDLRLAFPDPAIRYRVSEHHELTLRLFPAGYEWHVVSDTLETDFNYQAEGIRLQGIWSWDFAGAFAFDLSAGYEFDRRHRFVDDTGRLIDSAVGDQFLLMVGLRWGNGPVPYTNQVARAAR